MIPKVLFLFRIDNPILAKRFVRKVHAEALKEDPTVNLPLMTYLEEEYTRHTFITGFQRRNTN